MMFILQAYYASRISYRQTLVSPDEGDRLSSESVRVMPSSVIEAPCALFCGFMTRVVNMSLNTQCIHIYIFSSMFVFVNTKKFYVLSVDNSPEKLLHSYGYNNR
jgi:hypothetical protein